jgi:hypothetical protein
MKKTLTLLTFAMLLSTQAFASYTIVLKDGTRYDAKMKWTMQNGKALVTLTSGSTMTINPAEIDVAKTDEINNLGMGNVNVLSQGQPAQTNSAKQAPSLGQIVKMHRQQNPPPTPAPTTTAQAPSGIAPAAPAPIADQLDARLKDTFERAYENVGVFEHKLTGTNRSVRVQLTADSEEKVFNSISATAFLIARNAGLDGTQIDTVELYMATTTGGSAGRFQMNRADAESINNKAISQQDYFVRKVIY